jgi:hypothetical protein
MITTLLLTVVIVIFLGAMLALNPGRLAQAGSTSDQAQAELAAQAGLDYAKNRLQESVDWPLPGQRIVVNTPTLYIAENEGNVVGLMRQDTSQPYSMFRLRFNFHNGAASADPLDDGFDDPTNSAFEFPMEHVSINNLYGTAPRVVPKADSSFEVSDYVTGPYEIDQGSAVIAVEGLAGKGMANLTPANLATTVSGRNTASRTFEVVIKTALSDPATDAAVMGGADMTFNLPSSGGKEVEIKAKGGTARARSKGDITVNDGASPNYVSKGTVLYPDSTHTFTADTTVSTGTEGAADPYYTLDWADIHRADADPTKSVHIPGGTYVWWDNNELHYYDLDLTEYKALMSINPADPGIVLSDDLNEVRTAVNETSFPDGIKAQNGKFEVKEDVRVTTVDRSTLIPPLPPLADFNLIPRKGTKKSKFDNSASPNVGAEPAAKHGVDYEFKMSPKGGQASFTADGNVLISSKVDGDKGGSIIADGDLRLDAAKLEKYASVGISMYSSGDMEISTYHPENDSYGNIKVEGMFYSWGDLKVQAGESGSPGYADVDVKGAMVAYGSDTEPSTALPGTSGGNLEISGNKIKVEWDASKLGDLLDKARLAANTDLEIASFIKH